MRAKKQQIVVPAAPSRSAPSRRDASSPTASRPDQSRPGPSRRVAGWLSLSFILPFAALLVLSTLNIKLGQGYFWFRYSELRAVRTLRALPAIPVAAVACIAVHLLGQVKRTRRRIGFAALAASLLALGVWTWLAPPRAMTQHMFNLTSFSSDGAFRMEASGIPSLPEYLRHFPQRLQATPEQLGGTRVLSNPPGATVLARLFAPASHGEPAQPAWIERLIQWDDPSLTTAEAELIADAIGFGIGLTAMWVLSGFVAYGLGRVFLSRAGSAVFALLVTFNPCTVHFVPGKDPAQLLTINLMLWAWLRAVSSRRYASLGAFFAGAMLVMGSTVGLIHLWVALAVLLATLWQHARGGCPMSVRRQRVLQLIASSIVPALAGAVGVCALAWLAIGWNIPLTLWAVARRWGELQRTFAMSRAVWFVVGLPIFLLFLSPGLWTLLGMAIRRPKLDFGARLALCAAAVMLFIYVVVGMTYELPRLWVAFLPPLTLGLAANWPLLAGAARSAGAQHPRISKLLMLLVLTQIVFTLFHWTFLDAREAEYRLLSKRFYQ